MKTVSQVVGVAIIITSFLVIVVNNFLVTIAPSESYSRDIFGLIIPHPPVWVSYIPYLGFYLGLVFEQFSMHGLMNSGLLVILCLGVGLMKLGKHKTFDKMAGKIIKI